MKFFLVIFGIILMVGSFILKYVGESENISEIAGFWYIPVPIGLALLVIGLIIKKKKKA